MKDAEQVKNKEDDRETHGEEHHTEPWANSNKLDDPEVVLGFDDPEQAASCVYPPRVAEWGQGMSACKL